MLATSSSVASPPPRTVTSMRPSLLDLSPYLVDHSADFHILRPVLHQNLPCPPFAENRTVPGQSRVIDGGSSRAAAGPGYRSSGKIVALTTIPRAMPARTCAGVWSPTWTRDRAISATRGQATSRASPNTSSSTVAAPAAIAA
jgi:hypothetical protein